MTSNERVSEKRDRMGAWRAVGAALLFTLARERLLVGLDPPVLGARLASTELRPRVVP